MPPWLPERQATTALLQTNRRSFRPAGKTPKTCPAPFRKIFPFRRRAKHLYPLAYPIPKEGRIAIVTDAGWDAVDAAAAQTYVANADGEVVWS